LSVAGMIVVASTTLLAVGILASLAANVAVAEPTAMGRVIAGATVPSWTACS
jgi:hypothetical protein